MEPVAGSTACSTSAFCPEHAELMSPIRPAGRVAAIAPDEDIANSAIATNVIGSVTREELLA